MQLQAHWVSAAAQAEDATDFAHRLEASGVFLRFDEAVEPTMFRGSTMSKRELEQGRQIENVVRLGRVRRISATEVTLDEGSLPTDPGQMYIDCTASGVRATVPRPLFEDARINLEYVTVGVIPWSASIGGIHRGDAGRHLGEEPSVPAGRVLGLVGGSARPRPCRHDGHARSRSGSGLRGME